jgi:hypothetical protein
MLPADRLRQITERFEYLEAQLARARRPTIARSPASIPS